MHRWSSPVHLKELKWRSDDDKLSFTRWMMRKISKIIPANYERKGWGEGRVNWWYRWCVCFFQQLSCMNYRRNRISTAASSSSTRSLSGELEPFQLVKCKKFETMWTVNLFLRNSSHTLQAAATPHQRALSETCWCRKRVKQLSRGAPWWKVGNWHSWLEVGIFFKLEIIFRGYGELLKLFIAKALKLSKKRCKNEARVISKLLMNFRNN